MSKKIYQAELSPIFGTFQPVGLPDVGAPVYRNPVTGHLDLEVDTAQSMANRLEAQIWNAVKQTVYPEYEGIPYLVIKDQNGDFKASSFQLPTRAGSAYFAKHKEAKLGSDSFAKAFAELVRSKGLGPAVLSIDVGSLLFGTFFSHLEGGQYRVPRALTARIKAFNVVPVPVGGSSHDPITHGKDDLDPKLFTKGSKLSELGLGVLPYHAEEYAAKRIEFKAVFNRSMLEAMALPEEAIALIEAIADTVLKSFLFGDLRLRTTEYELVQATCDGHELSSQKSDLKPLIKACSEHFSDPVVTEVNLTLKPKPDPKKEKKEKN